MSDSDLCQLCRTIPFFDLPEAPEAKAHTRVGGVTQNPARWLPDDLKSETAQLGFAHHKSIEALAQSAQTCTLCRLINAEVAKWLDRYDEAYELNGNNVQSDVEWGWHKRPSDQQLWLTRRLTGGDGFMVLAKDAGGTYGEKPLYVLAGVGLCVDADSPLASHMSGRPIQQDSASQQSLDVASAWLKGCVDSHEECSLSEEAVLPTRVLDVGTSEDYSIKLVATAGACGSWVSLSHCWGGQVFLTTTTQNMLSHMAGIDIDRLPQTFQDAVVITRRMGCRYLWIDSLCICQDDAEDWAREAGKMSNVYANAHLVIAANRASRGSEGCFSIRDDRHHVKVRVSTAQGELADVKAMALSPGREALSPFDVYWENEPLISRAWALQERLLARRTLHYCTDQMYFECSRGLYGEDGCKADDHFLQPLTEVKRGLSQADSLLGSAYQKHWDEVVLKYRRRAITRRSDTLPSLSGLAKLFSKRGAEYVAGLWGDALIEGLAWRGFQTAQSIEQDTIESTDDSGPVPYIAPSWSWASFGGIASTARDASFMGTTWKDTAVVEGFHCDLKTPDPFGEITGGWIKIKGPVVPAKWVFETPWQPDDQYLHHGICYIQTSVPDGKKHMAHLEYPRRFASESDQSTDLGLLVLGCHVGKKLGYFFMLLTPSGKPNGEMKRVGWSVANDFEVKDGLEKYTRTVVIV